MDPILEHDAQQCLENLQSTPMQSSKVRATFILHRRDGLSFDEIAKQLGIHRPAQRPKNLRGAYNVGVENSREECNPMKELGLDGRHRDRDGKISQKRSDTRNENLPTPIPQFRSDATRKGMRKATGETSEKKVRQAAAELKKK